MGNSKERKNNYITEIDYLRGFSIIAVIAIHTSCYFSKIPEVNTLLKLNIIINTLSFFAVPLFVFISGFVLNIKYRGSFSKRIFYSKRLMSVLPQYVIFSIIYLAVTITYLYMQGSEQQISFLMILFKIFTASSFSHLWYISLIVQLYIIYPYIEKIHSNYFEKGSSIFFLLLVLIIQNTWNMFIAIVCDNVDNSHIELTNRIFISHLFYFILGIHISRNYSFANYLLNNSKKWILPTICVITVLTIIISGNLINGINEYGKYEKIPNSYSPITNSILPLYYVLIFYIIAVLSRYLTKIPKIYSNFMYSLGKYSFGIYLIHPLYILLIANLIYPKLKIFPTQQIFYPILFISTIIFSWYNVNFIKNLPYSEYIIGK